jgi:hypothetical protein
LVNVGDFGTMPPWVRLDIGAVKEAAGPSDFAELG